MSLVEVRRFEVPEKLVRQTEDDLRRAGAEGYELFVLWTGTQAGEVFTVRNSHVPKQTSYRLETGLCVRVGGDELHRLNVWLYEAAQMLAVQIHTHPREAYHSDTDDAYPMVTEVGGLSIVLPDFAQGGFVDPGVALYRLSPEGWDRLSAPAAASLVQVI